MRRDLETPEARDFGPLLERVGRGEAGAWDELVTELYSSLRGIAHRIMQNQAPGSTLQTTVLVHEAYVKMVGGQHDWETRRHFLRVAAKAMRHVLVDHERNRRSSKRGGAWDRVMLTEEVAAVSRKDIDMLALDEALGRLTALDSHTAEVAELRCFGGLEHSEIAAVTGRSRRTVERTWRFARTWLEREMA